MAAIEHGIQRTTCLLNSSNVLLKSSLIENSQYRIVITIAFATPIAAEERTQIRRFWSRCALQNDEQEAKVDSRPNVCYFAATEGREYSDEVGWGAVTAWALGLRLEAAELLRWTMRSGQMPRRSVAAAVRKSAMAAGVRTAMLNGEAMAVGSVAEMLVTRAEGSWEMAVDVTRPGCVEFAEAISRRE